MKLASAKGIALPARGPGEHQQHAERLGALSGAAFDKAYMDKMVQDHGKTIALFEQQAKGGKDAELKAFAAKTLPTLREHLAAAKTVHAGLK